jgi:hypothetical protein
MPNKNPLSYSSSEAVGQAFDNTLPAATAASSLQQSSPFGGGSPKAALLNAILSGMNVFRGEEGQRGSRMARQAAPLINRRR